MSLNSISMFGWLGLWKRKNLWKKVKRASVGKRWGTLVGTFCPDFVPRFQLFSYIHRPVLSQPGICFLIPSFEPAHPAAFCHEAIRYRMYRRTGRGWSRGSTHSDDKRFLCQVRQLTWLTAYQTPFHPQDECSFCLNSTLLSGFISFNFSAALFTECIDIKNRFHRWVAVYRTEMLNSDCFHNENEAIKLFNNWRNYDPFCMTD